MTPVSRPGRAKRPARGERRPQRPAPVRRRPEPVPLERGRATGILVGLFVFTAGFAIAAIDLFLFDRARAPYLAGVGIGFFGIGVVGFFLNRGTVPRPEAPIWSPTGIRALTRPLGLPPVPVAALLYALTAVGIVGNFVIPMFFAR